MSYDYQKIKPQLFREEAQEKFLAIRDRIRRLCEIAGCCTVEKALAEARGDSWESLSCVDRLEEIGEIRVQRGETITQLYVIFPRVPR